MSFADINILAVIVVTILNILLGMFWYSPQFLGTQWAQEHQFILNDLKPTPWHYIGAILVSLVTVVIFSALIHWFHVDTLGAGLQLGFFIWLGFVATTHFSGVIWARKPWKAYLIDTGFQLVSLLMMGIILSLWY